MNTRRIWLAAGLLASVSAHAEGLYIGGKVGIMTVDDNAFNDATNAGVVLGYEFPSRTAASFAIEAEFTTSVSDGDFRVFGVNGDWDMDTQALYAAVRFGHQFYAKGRIGYLNEDVTARAGGFSANDDDSGLSAGLGGGWRVNEHVSLEAEYTLIEEDVDFWSIGLNVSF